jgi:hypothetical protein
MKTKQKSMATEAPVGDVNQTALIAPCGMNCRLCSAYMRIRNPCPGCRGDDRGKPKTRVRCRIKNCKRRLGGKAGYCCDCSSFPCELLTRLDQRYRKNYGMSMIENLKAIRTSGILDFIRSEQTKWACPGCGATICVHQARCLECQRKWH